MKGEYCNAAKCAFAFEVYAASAAAHIHIRQLEKSLCNDDEHSSSHSLFHTHTHKLWGRASRLHSKNGENEQFFTATLDLICMCLTVCVFIKLMKIARHYFKLHTYIRVRVCECVFRCTAKLCNAVQKSFHMKRMKNRYESEAHSLAHTHARTNHKENVGIIDFICKNAQRTKETDTINCTHIRKYSSKSI